MTKGLALEELFLKSDTITIRSYRWKNKHVNNYAAAIAVCASAAD